MTDILNDIEGFCFAEIALVGFASKAFEKIDKGIDGKGIMLCGNAESLFDGGLI